MGVWSGGMDIKHGLLFVEFAFSFWCYWALAWGAAMSGVERAGKGNQDREVVGKGCSWYFESV